MISLNYSYKRTSKLFAGGVENNIEKNKFNYINAVNRMIDESTSALDPISESKMYDKFNKIYKNQTTIFISHRLGSTKPADIIFVIDNRRD